ncbi:MAG: YqeG family HAD IIIA-type phosphatase [Bacilli bacterium]|nr:YqeG family HAD IIIA-type phosphatase [Bacilli bacterium]
MELFLPDIYQKSIYTIDYSKLLSRGIKCLLFDLDNTIVPCNSSEPSSKAKDLFTSLKQKGFKVIIFTNSPKIRLRNFQNAFGVDGVSNACKPFTHKLRKLLKDYGYGINEVAIIGDQLMTDIKAGNTVGITSILVNPVSEKDFLLTKINRFFEERKIKDLTNKGLFYKGRYYE